MCVCGGGWGVNYRTTAGGRGLASGMPSPERPGRPKTFSRLWSPICNGKPSSRKEMLMRLRGGHRGENVALCQLLQAGVVRGAFPASYRPPFLYFSNLFLIILTKYEEQKRVYGF